MLYIGQFFKSDIEFFTKFKREGEEKMVKFKDYEIAEDNFYLDVTYPLTILNRTEEQILNSVGFIASRFRLNLEMFIHNNRLFIKVRGQEKEIDKFKLDLLTFPYFYG